MANKKQPAPEKSIRQLVFSFGAIGGAVIIAIFGLVNVVPWGFQGLVFAASPWIGTPSIRIVAPPSGLAFAPPADINTRDEASTTAKHLGTCKDDALNASVDVYTIDKFPDYDSVLGEFSAPGGLPRITIRSDSININTVAHEVHHFVDISSASKGISDGETAAYEQGYFTQCVWDLLNKK